MILELSKLLPHDCRRKAKARAKEFGTSPMRDANAFRHAKATAERNSDGVRLEHFYALMPSHAYIFDPSGDPWPAASVNERLPAVAQKGEMIPAARWLSVHRPIEQLTWAPGEPKLINDKLIKGSGWISHRGANVLNSYVPPSIAPGDPNKAGPWIDHIRWMFPNDAGHIFLWFAHRRQKPDEKINHALLFAGAPGIGKDSGIEPLRVVVGTGNFQEISPDRAMGRFNPFVKSVVCRISEAKDSGDYDRFNLYTRLLTYLVTPPETVTIDEKNIREYLVPNITSFIITSNHELDAIYLPADDRRYFVAQSPRTKAKLPEDYFARLWQWYLSGGFGHVAAYLDSVDLSNFDPKAPPPKTHAFWSMHAPAAPPEEKDLADVLEQLGSPGAVTLSAIRNAADMDLLGWLNEHRTPATQLRLR